MHMFEPALGAMSIIAVSLSLTHLHSTPVLATQCLCEFVCIPKCACVRFCTALTFFLGYVSILVQS